MSVPVFLIERDRLYADLDDDTVVLDGPEGRHAALVRRLRVGERLDLTDGAGSVAECVVADSLRDRLRLKILKRYGVPAPQPRVVVVQALPKGERGELAVEMLTEAGVDEIVPWAAAHCVTQWRGDRAAKSLGRWRSAAREAAKQSRRFHLPEVPELATTAQVAGRLANASGAFVLHEKAGSALSSTDVPHVGEILVVVGPEGGLTDGEVAGFEAVGAVPVRLGPAVLRTSTAGLAAAAVLFARCGRW